MPRRLAADATTVNPPVVGVTVSQSLETPPGAATVAVRAGFQVGGVTSNVWLTATPSVVLNVSDGGSAMMP
jgi:hypothetical protein